MRDELPFPSLGLRDKPAQNADGLTDLYHGAKARGGKRGNWLATAPGKGYFASSGSTAQPKPQSNRAGSPV